MSIREQIALLDVSIHSPILGKVADWHQFDYCWSFHAPNLVKYKFNVIITLT